MGSNRGCVAQSALIRGTWCSKAELSATSCFRVVHPLARAPTATHIGDGTVARAIGHSKVTQQPRNVKRKIARVADPVAEMDADAEHSQAVAAADTQLPAAASNNDIFKVCFNPAVTEGLSDCESFKVRDLINSSPENEDSAHADSHTPPRPAFSMCAHFHGARCHFADCQLQTFILHHFILCTFSPRMVHAFQGRSPDAFLSWHVYIYFSQCIHNLRALLYSEHIVSYSFIFEQCKLC